MCKWKTLLISFLVFSLFGAANAQQMVNQRHLATRYHQKFENRKTSSGERFSQKKYTAAHHNIKLGTYVLVVDTIAKKWVVVKVNDRCPRRNIIDLAGIAAERIGITKRKGVSRVLVSTLGDEGETLWRSQDSLPADYYDSLFQITNTVSTFQQPAVSDNTPRSQNASAKHRQNPTTGTPNKDSEKGTGIIHNPKKIYISNIENTDEAEDLLDEMQPSISQNAKIINENKNEIKIEIYFADGDDNFVEKFTDKHPHYTLTVIDMGKK